MTEDIKLHPLPEFLKIKEKQKAFGMNNGLRVHEVMARTKNLVFILTMLPSERCYGQGCDGFHARHVGKLAFDLKVTTCIHPACLACQSCHLIKIPIKGCWSRLLGPDCLHHGQIEEARKRMSCSRP